MAHFPIPIFQRKTATQAILGLFLGIFLGPALAARPLGESPETFLNILRSPDQVVLRHRSGSAPMLRRGAESGSRAIRFSKLQMKEAGLQVELSAPPPP